MTDIANNLQRIRTKITAAENDAGRKAGSVRLIAVSKTKPIDAIKAALANGQNLFGENRVQEAATKFPELRMQHPGIKLHLIGPLQTNKVDEAVELFDVIETLDRPKLADALTKSIKKIGRNPVCYIQINIGNEPQKSGIAPDELAAFLDYSRKAGITITGIMCIPPQAGDPAPHFARMQELAAQHKLDEISMGMSADYEIAIHHGATSVRVGSAIFGER